MEYMGQTQTATYMTGPKLSSTTTSQFLPSIGSTQSSYKAFDTYPAPSPLRRSHTTLPWRPSTYYGVAKVNPTVANAQSLPNPLSYTNELGELDNVKVPPVFAAARNALYTRYTPNDWSKSNQSNYLLSDRVRSAGERLRLDTVRMCRETDDKTKRTQADVGKRLGERIGDIQFWKNEVNHETDLMIQEINDLTEAKRVLEKTLAETANPLHIAQECLYNREKRQGIDLVHDPVERELIKEVDIIKRCQADMQRVVDKANAQLALNRAAQHELEKDSGDKHSAQNLDQTCHGLKNTSRGIAYHNGIERVDNTSNDDVIRICVDNHNRENINLAQDYYTKQLTNKSIGKSLFYQHGVDPLKHCTEYLTSTQRNSVPETWAEFSNNNIKRSQAERANSKAVRVEIADTINRCSNEMWNQWNKVNTEFTRRIGETTDARNKIQTHLSRVLQEIFDMEKNIELLKKSISDKEAPMMVAQTRLETRTHRPNVEACRDPVQHRLVSEVHEINETWEALNHRLREAENALQQLLRSKSSLEHDLSVKNNSLFIDREKCMGMRKTFPMSPRVVSV